jgi:uncharacterized protein YjiK
MRKQLTLIAMLLVVSCSLSPNDGSTSSKPEGKKKREPRTDILGQPDLVVSTAELGFEGASGIAYHPKLGHLFVVGDRGNIAELDGAGRRVRMAPIKGDLEDVAVYGLSGQLVLVSEKKSRLILFDPVAFSEIKRWHLDRDAIIGGAFGERNKGFEGLTWRPDPARPGGGVFYLVHQALPAMIVSLAFDPAANVERLGVTAVLDRWPLKSHAKLTALTYLPTLDRLVLINGHKRHLIVLRLDGTEIADFALGDIQPEGVCIDGQGNLWIADDQQGVLRFDGALAAIAAHLAAGPTAR